MDVNDRIRRLIDRHRRFFADDKPGRFLVIIPPYTYPIDYDAYGLPGRPLSAWNFKTDLEEYVQFHVARQRAYLDHTRDLDADDLPVLNFNAGYGAHSAYFSGQEVILGADTSWTHPCIHAWDDVDRLREDPDNFWFRTVVAATRRFVELSDGDYVVSAFSNAGPGDMANALRGNDLFTDLYDEPEQAERLFDRCADAAIWMERALRKEIGLIEGGTVTANCWYPCEAPYISEDFWDLCPADLYRELGRPRTQRVIDAFGGAYLHHHAKGWHVHSAHAELHKLRLLEISWDPNCPRPVDRLDELAELQGNVPLMIRCHATDLPDRIEPLKQFRAVIMLNIDNLDQGRRALDLVRRHSRE